MIAVSYPFAVFVRGGRLALLTGIVAVLLACVAGCSGGGSKPVSLPTLPPTSSSSASPIPTTTAGAAEASALVLRQYFSLLNLPTTVANGRALAALMTPQCQCRRVATSVIDLAKKHQTYFGRNHVVSVTASADGPLVVEALVEYDYTSGGIKDSRGRVLSRTPGRSGAKLNFILNLRAGQWLIAEVQLINQGHA